MSRTLCWLLGHAPAHEDWPGNRWTCRCGACEFTGSWLEDTGLFTWATRNRGAVRTVKTIVSFNPPWWRHPIRWWRLRHLRADIAAEDQDPLVKDLRQEIARREDEAFLYGEGSSRHDTPGVVGLWLPPREGPLHELLTEQHIDLMVDETLRRNRERRRRQ